MEWTYGELTQRVIVCAMKAHRVPGTGFPEYVFAQALQTEPDSARISAEREYLLPYSLRAINRQSWN